MARKYDYKRPTDITVTTTEQTIGPFTAELLRDINLYFDNKGNNEVFFEILGSPSGVKTGDVDAVGHDLSATNINIEWKSIMVDSLLAGAKDIFEIDNTWNYLKIILWTISGDSTFNYFLQHKGGMPT